MISAGSA
ncbi:hypothetical protein Nmel_001968, partial [Mimus melanotis]